MTVDAFGGYTSRAARFLTIALVAAVLAGCSLFGPVKVKEDPIIPATTLYQKALDDIDRRSRLDPNMFTIMRDMPGG